ncbi:MAG: hypothetical protein ABI175_05260 [Polyangiales bacterium]
MRSVLLALVVMSCGGSPKPVEPTKPVAPAAPAKMASFTTNGYTLTGAEYWPYAGTEDIKYPEAVLWGFYPQQGVVPDGETDPNPASARPEAIACAEKAYAALQAFIASDPPVLKKVVAAGEAKGTMVPRFYLWTNDYGRAANPYPPGVREARLWWWARKQPDPPKPPGYWKWESVVTQSGECVIPHQPQIDQYLAEMASKLP